MTYKFNLTFEWSDKKTVTASTSFLAPHKENAWKQARKWQDNCFKICGKNELGKECTFQTLEIVQ